MIKNKVDTTNYVLLLTALLLGDLYQVTFRPALNQGSKAHTELNPVQGYEDKMISHSVTLVLIIAANYQTATR